MWHVLGWHFGAAFFSSLAGLAALAVLLFGLITLIIERARKAPAERERKRRLAVNAKGRMGDAVVTDIRDDLVLYSYSVGGVTYSASQDVSLLSEALPGERGILVGAASIKYHPRNPANSIVVCERWTGLRTAPRVPADPQAAALKS